ncbi:hypothetical protein PHMEG_00026457 [Phytophthora megakarya]|uniref:RxLR effector protein n=1 Tax=Phytophthora megakarya TaxID=4795 RepID=A0A225V979_9STRA|nr:hypothetical protein PHMEG_00026457 [Phytophthora megakarya]
MRLTYFLVVACGILATSINDFADAKIRTPTVASSKSTKEGGVAIAIPAKSQDYGKPIDQGALTEERALISPWIKDALKSFWKKPKLFLQYLISMIRGKRLYVKKNK